MRKPSAVRDWFKNDSAQLAWANDYWRNKSRFELAAGMTVYEAAVRILERLQTTPDGRELLGKMRRAWNSHASKERGQRRTFSFVLPTRSEARLRDLSRKRAKSATLEELIDLAYDYEKRMGDVRRAEIEAAKKAVREAAPKRFSPTAEELALKAKLADLEATHRELESTLVHLLQENCQLRVLLQEADVNPDKRLNAEQQTKAEQEYQNRVSYLRRDIAARAKRARNTPPST